MMAGARKQSAATTARPRRSLHGVILLFVVVLLMPLVSLSSCILLCVGMLPTVIAFVVDRTRERFTTVSVGGLNFAGVTPFLVELWFDSSGVPGVMAIITDGFAMGTIYAAAAAGWFLFIGLPGVIEVIDDLLVARRIEEIRSRQEYLANEWGADTVGAPVEASYVRGNRSPEDRDPAERESEESEES